MQSNIINQLCQRLKKMEEKGIYLTVESGTTALGPPDQSVTLNLRKPTVRTLRIWSQGGINIDLQDGSALLEIEMANILEGNGAPIVPPADPTRPALYVNRLNDDLYYWNNVALMWILIVGSGDDGATGPMGPLGNTGNTGIAGLIGNTGAFGGIGNVGPQGLTGLIGAMGIDGNVGGMGPQGLTGNVGPIGPAGTGSQGPTGNIGGEGNTGLSGPTGENCSELLFTGYTGLTGATIGIMGATGDFVTVIAGTSGSIIGRVRERNLVPITQIAEGIFPVNSTNSRGIIVDQIGNIYVTGSFGGTCTFGSITINSISASDVFVAKFGNDHQWQWVSTGLGAPPSTNSSRAIAVDCENNSYICGTYTTTITFGSITLSTFQGFIGGGSNIYVVKLDADGNFLWASTGYDGTVNTSPINSLLRNIKVDNDKNVYVSGFVEQGVDYIFTPSTPTVSLPDPSLLRSNRTAIVSKLDTDGNWLWVAFSGGLMSLPNFNVPFSEAYDLDLDINGNLYVTGGTNGTTSFGKFILSAPNTAGVLAPATRFLNKLDINGIWQWVKSLSPNIVDTLPRYPFVKVDRMGNIYTNSIELFGNKFPSNFTADSIAYGVFSKFNTNGELLWTSYINPIRLTQFDVATSSWLAIDNDANCYLVANINSSTVTFGTYTLTDGAGIAKIDTNGVWKWAKNVPITMPIGGGSINNIATDNQNNIYIVGNFAGTATFDSITLMSTGAESSYVSQLLSGDETFRPLAILNGEAVPNDTPKVCFLDGNVIETFSGLESGYQYYLNEDAQLTKCLNEVRTVDPIGISLTNTKMVGK